VKEHAALTSTWFVRCTSRETADTPTLTDPAAAAAAAAAASDAAAAAAAVAAAAAAAAAAASDDVANAGATGRRRVVVSRLLVVRCSRSHASFVGALTSGAQFTFHPLGPSDRHVRCQRRTCTVGIMRVYDTQANSAWPSRPGSAP